MIALNQHKLQKHPDINTHFTTQSNIHSNMMDGVVRMIATAGEDCYGVGYYIS